MKMKMNAVEFFQHMNVALMLGFCLLYSYWSFSFGFGFGLFIWGGAVLLLYFPNLMIIPGVTGEGKNSVRKASILGAWCLMLWWTGLYSENNLLIIMSCAILVLLLAYCIFFIRKWKKEHPQREGEEQ